MVLPNPFYDPSGGLPDVRDPFGGAYENSGEGPGRPEGGGGGRPPFDPNLTTRVYSPPTRGSLARYSNQMPFPLSINRGGLLGIIQTAGNIVGGFLPGPQVQTPKPGTVDWCKEHPGDIGCVMGAADRIEQVYQQGVNMTRAMLQGGDMSVQATLMKRPCVPCSLSRPMKATTRHIKGRWCMNEQGQPICIPRKRRMNPGNSRAALRAARRLKGVFRFQKRVEKALARAVRGSGIRRQSYARSRCGTCRKTKCSC